MKFYVVFYVVFILIINTLELSAQSAVYVYKDIDLAEGDYMFVRGVPSKSEAEFLSLQKMEELANRDDKIQMYASTDKRGHGVIIKSFSKIKGKKVPVFGAALGCSSSKEATALAIINLKKFNPEWQQTDYVVVDQFRD